MTETSKSPGPGANRRWRRRLLGWTTLVVLTAVALVAIGPLFVDTSAVRTHLVRVASNALGHEVSLDGTVHLRLLPRPAFVFDGVHIRNPRWPGGSELMSAERIVVAPVLADLLRGEFSMDNMTFVGVEVWLERDADGHLNWQSGTSAGTLPFLDDLRGRDVVIRYKSGGRAATLDVARLRGRIGGGGGLAVHIDGRIDNLDVLVPGSVLDVLGVEHDGVKVDTRLAIGPGATLELSDMKLSAPRLAASGSVRLQWLQDIPSVDARIQINELVLPGRCPGPGATESSERLADLLQVRPLDKTVAVAWTGSMSVDIDRLRFDELSFADVRILAASNPEHFTIRAASAADAVGIELRRAPQGVSGARLELRAGTESAPGVLRCAGLLPVHADGIQAVAVDAEGQGRTWGEILEHVEGRVRAWGRAPAKALGWTFTSIEARLSEGRLEHVDLAVSHETEATINVSGSGGPLRGLVDGEWPFQASWIDDGVEVKVNATLTPGPDGLTVGGSFKGTRRLGKGSRGLAMQARGNWRYAPGSVEFTKLDIALAGNTLKGDMRFDMNAEPLGVTGHLKLAKTDLEWLASLAPEGAADGLALPDFVLDAFRVEIGELEGLPLPIQRLDTRLTTRGDELRLGLLAFDLLAARWRGGGTLNMASKVPTATFELATEQLGLEALSGRTALLGNGMAEGLKVLGHWSGLDFGAVASSLEMDASARRVSVAGLPTPVGPVVLEDLNARFRPATGLSGSARATVKGETFEVDLAATPGKDDSRWAMTASATGGPGRVRVEGSLEALIDAGGRGLDVSVQGDDVARALALVGVQQGRLSGPYQGTARLSRDGDQIVLAPLELTVGTVGAVAGEIRIAPRAEGRQLITARLASDRLDLTGLTPILEAPEGEEGRRIPNPSMPVPPSLEFDANLDLSATEVIAPPHRLRDVEVKIESRQDRFIIERARVTLESGDEFTARVETAAGDPAPSWKLDVEGRNVDIGILVPDRPPEEPIGWPANVKLELEGAGRDLRELLASARGSLHVSGKQTVRGAEDFSAWEVNIMTMMLPRLGKPKRSRLACASLEAEFADGKLTTEALIIDAANVTIAGSGSLDLRTEAIDLVLVPAPKQRSLLSGSTPVHVTGTLNAPEISVATGALVASTGTLLLGAVTPYLLLGAFLPTSSDDQAACEHALDEVMDIAEEASDKAIELEKSRSSGEDRRLTSP